MNTMIMSKSLHDILAALGRFVLPALSVLITSLGEIWTIPYAKEIALTVTAVSVFINAVVDIDTHNYLSERS